MIAIFELIFLTIFLLVVYIFYRGLKSIIIDIFIYFNKQKHTKPLNDYQSIKLIKNKEVKKIIGIGGGGSNIVEYLYRISDLPYDPLVINSDKKALDLKKVPSKIYLNSPKSYGCGSNEVCGLNLVDETALDQVKNFIGTTNKVYIIVTLGGGVGSGSTKAIVKYLFEQDIDVHLIVVYPFSWEGIKKTKKADDTLEFSRAYCKKVNVFKNDDLKQYSEKSMKECFNLLNKSVDKTIKEVL